MNLKKNLIYNILYQISVIIIPLVTAPYISRVIGSSGVGIYSYSTSVASYFALFMLLGIGNYGVRTIAKVRDNKELCSKTFWELYTFQLICSFLVLLIYIIYIIFIEKAYFFALVIQTMYILSVMLDINWYFAGTEQFKITVTRGMVIKFIQVLLIFILVKSANDIYIYISIMAGGTLIGQISLLPILLRQLNFVKVKKKDIVKHIKPNLVLFVPILATSIFTIMDKIMIESINHDIASVGLYEYSEKIVKLPLGIISAIGTVMLPKISNLLSNNNEDMSLKYFDISMKYIGILVIAMTFGIAAIAPVFAIVFYGQEFAKCGDIITILSIILITSSWANIIRTQYLIPKEREKAYIIATIIGAITNLILNFAFIPLYGAIGAAIGTIGAELALSITHTVATWNQLNLKKHLLEWFLFAIIGLLMFAIVRIIGAYMKAEILTLIIQISIGGLIYIGLIFLLLFIRRDSFITNMINKKIKGGI